MHSCHGKAVSITYSKSGFVVLGMKRAMRIRYIVFCGMSGCTIFCYSIIQAQFSGGGDY